MFDKSPPLTTGLQNGKIPAPARNEFPLQAAAHHSTDPFKGNSQCDDKANSLSGGLYQGAVKPNRFPGARNQQAQRAVDGLAKTFQQTITTLSDIEPNVHAKIANSTVKGSSYASKTQTGQRAITSSGGIDTQTKSKGLGHPMAKHEVHSTKGDDVGASSRSGGQGNGNRMHELNNSSTGVSIVPSTPLPGSYNFSSALTPFEPSHTRVHIQISPTNVISSQPSVEEFISTVFLRLIKSQ